MPVLAQLEDNAKELIQPYYPVQHGIAHFQAQLPVSSW